MRKKCLSRVYFSSKRSQYHSAIFKPLRKYLICCSPLQLIIQTKTEVFCFASFLARDACYAALEKRRASCKPIEFDRVLEFEGARICDSPIDSGDRHGITFKRQAHSSDKNRSPSTSSESYKNDIPHESKEPDFKENNLQNGGWMAKLIGSNTAASSYHGLLLIAVLFIAVNIVMAMMAMSTMYRLSLVMEELSGFEGTVAEE
ncbi:hypothetical protein BDR26DRAFT_225214 [Obelidium mucronatum]|nr:hypothetical protein BDR26DRAFT_225214 [Obelidium mucronatum]